MGLTKIELIGFKSFADKETILFENGVTGIVGPNGCGKSNVADAIKWVIGETSAKQLRGSSMTDVIFNGTENRKSVSSCEVSLFFDNKDGAFKQLPFEEVIFTRKLYRDGESAYFINREQARLKDIINNLHDVGISKEGYSIIGQGKVADIMSSKPEDRRAIFEEAVGIAKAKKDKIDSERSLEKTRENIRQQALRVADLEKRLAPKAAAAEKTNEYNRLAKELKFHEINTYIYNYESANGKREVINKKIDEIKEEIFSFTSALNEAQHNYNVHSAEAGSADGQIAELNAVILDKTVGVTKREGEAQVFNERISFLKTEIDRLIKENTSARFSIENLNADDKECDERKKELEKSVADISEQISALNSEISALTLKIDEGEMEQLSAHNKALESAENLAKVMQSLGSLEAEQSVISERQKEVIQKLNELKEKYKQTVFSKEKCETALKEKEELLALYKDKCDKKEQEIAETDDKTEALSEKIYNLNSELSALQSKYNVYQRIKDSYEGYNGVVQRVMKDATTNSSLKNKIKGLVASVINTEKAYEIAIETALGAAAQYVITQTPDDAKYVLEYLKVNKIGRLTCLPLNSVKPRYDAPETRSAKRERGAVGLATELVKFNDEFAPVVQHLLGNTLICQDNDSALRIAKTYRFGFKIVTLDGQVYNPNGSMTGGSVKQTSSGLLSAGQQVGDIEKVLGEKSRLMLDLKKQKDALVEKSDRLFEELNELNSKSSTVKGEVASLKEQLAGISSVYETIKADIDSYTEALKIVNEKLSGLSSQYSDASKGNKMLLEERNAISSDSQKQKENFDALKRQKEELVEKRTLLQTELAEKRQELINIDGEKKKIALSIKGYYEQIEKNNSLIAVDNEKISSAQKDADKKALSEEEQAEIDSLKKELEKLTARKNELNELIRQDEEKRMYLNEQINALNEKRHAQENGLIKIDSDLEFLQEKVYSSYQLDYEECKEFKAEEYNLDEGAQEMKRLRTRINFLGPINPTAPEEYEADNNEYLTLLAQKEDMEKGADDMDKAVKILTEDLQKKFDKGFAQIREYFKTIFKVMFGGGDADLVVEPIEEGEDPLDAGIEIKAQPPGKSLKSISLLSGGEQALTAIAILFAILKLRPLPFCVLDEIEAPLDDANVARFANYLKKFSEDTQFIVITHKKPTMERADALYGVTMPEKGVSKTVSVKITDVDRMGLNK